MKTNNILQTWHKNSCDSTSLQHMLDALWDKKARIVIRSSPMQQGSQIYNQKEVQKWKTSYPCYFIWAPSDKNAAIGVESAANNLVDDGGCRRWRDTRSFHILTCKTKPNDTHWYPNIIQNGTDSRTNGRRSCHHSKIIILVGGSLGLGM
jgi:hypothetical protein